MKRLGLVALCVFALAVLLVVSSGNGDAAPFRQGGGVGTAITYQGRLLDAGNNPIQGTCAMTLTLWTAATAGSQVGSSQVFTSVVMSSGFFLVEPDFGSSAWTGEARWLQIESACNGGATETFDRQAVHVVPYAVHSLDATATPQPTATLVATATPQPTATPLANVAFTNVANTFSLIQTINSTLDVRGNIITTGTLTATLGTSGFIPFAFIAANPSPSSYYGFAAVGTIGQSTIIRQYRQLVLVTNTNDQNNYWTLNIYRMSDFTPLFSVNTTGLSANTWSVLSATDLSHSLTLAHLGVGVYIQATGSPGSLYMGGIALYGE